LLQKSFSFRFRYPESDSGAVQIVEAEEVIMASSKIKIKRNDRVEVIAGKDKGKQGRVLRVIAEKDRVLVEHVMMVKKHMKPNPQKNIQGGIAEQESPIHISNVMLIDGEGNRTRVGTRMEGDKKVRFSKASGGNIPDRKK
jgi:large subunit ribosomal protein L24